MQSQNEQKFNFFWESMLSDPLSLATIRFFSFMILYTQDLFSPPYWVAWDALGFCKFFINFLVYLSIEK